MSKLAEIFENKRQEVAASKADLPPNELRSRLADLPPTSGFLAALQRSPHDLSLIAEVKAASPSQGQIRPNFDPAEVASAYKRAGAECLSVLTDRVYFGGDPQNIAIAKAASGLPALRKDFIDDEYQIDQARVWGADAILLIVAALDPLRLGDLHGYAESLGLDVLVEIHNFEEAEVALQCGAKLIGVNNRDLSTFRTSLEVSDQLLPIIAPHAFAVSESALATRADLDRVKAAGACGVLIGTTFCASADIQAKVHEVMGR
jgi:indole-3-glycerol phosphate synthase